MQIHFMRPLIVIVILNFFLSLRLEENKKDAWRF